MDGDGLFFFGMLVVFLLVGFLKRAVMFLSGFLVLLFFLCLPAVSGAQLTCWGLCDTFDNPCTGSWYLVNNDLFSSCVSVSGPSSKEVYLSCAGSSPCDVSNPPPVPEGCGNCQSPWVEFSANGSCAGCTCGINISSCAIRQHVNLQNCACEDNILPSGFSVTVLKVMCYVKNVCFEGYCADVGQLKIRASIGSGRMYVYVYNSSTYTLRDVNFNQSWGAFPSSLPQGGQWSEWYQKSRVSVRDFDGVVEYSVYVEPLLMTLVFFGDLEDGWSVLYPGDYQLANIPPVETDWYQFFPDPWIGSFGFLDCTASGLFDGGHGVKLDSEAVVKKSLRFTGRGGYERR